MLTNLDFVPRKIETLEEIINFPKQSQMLKKNFPEFRHWFEILFKLLEKENHKELITKQKIADDIAVAGNSIYFYYKYLKDFLENPETLEQMEHFSQVGQLQHMVEIVCYFDSLQEVFCLDKSKPDFKLCKDLKQENAHGIYTMFLNAYSKLLDVLYEIGNSLYKINVERWENIVFKPSSIGALNGTSTQSTEEVSTLAQPTSKPCFIPGIQYVLVDFVHDTSRLSRVPSVMYKTHSANLLRTDRTVIGDYGFIYDFSPETLVEYDFDSVTSDDWFNNKLVRIHQSLLASNLSEQLSYEETYAIWELNPLYNIDEVIAKAGRYTIEIKSGSKPFGIFIWKEKLNENLKTVQSLSTTMHLPLLIAESNVIQVVPWQNVFDI